MRKYYFILLLLTMALLLSACGSFNNKYRQIGEYNGIVLFLDSDSIQYDKTNGKVLYWTKLSYDDKAKTIASINWARAGHNGINPFLEMNQSLILYEAIPVTNKSRIVEINYMDKNDKSILRTPYEEMPTSWTVVGSDTVPGKTYQAVIDILKKQGKL